MSSTESNVLFPASFKAPASGWRVPRGCLAVVVGAGRSGRAASRLLAREGARVRLLEANPANATEELKAELEPLGVEIVAGDQSRAQFEGAALVVPSPGMPLLKLQEILGLPGTATDGQGPEILAETELAWRLLDGEPCIAVTGTSGKTTTVSLAAAMLQEAGRKVFLGGNIGTPLSEYLLAGERADVLVLEVSSFQLQACSRFHPQAAAILNVTPNHLDYHRDMEEYVSAKFRIFMNQTAGDLAVVPEVLLGEAKGRGCLARLEAFEARGRFQATKLIGRHNDENCEAAWLLCRAFGVAQDEATRAVAAFEPIPHRLERVCEKDGILYVNDSKSTTVSSMETALKAMDRPVLLLCGGKFKGGDLGALLPLLREKVRAVAGFGASQDIFEAAWKGKVDMAWFPALKPAVLHLYAKARPGDCMLLSPATASFDLYKGMAYRGQDFKDIVGGLG